MPSRSLKLSWKRGFLLVFFGSLVVLISISRIPVGEHWASEVLGSYLFCTLTVIAIIQFHRWRKTRFFVLQPLAAAA